MNSFVRVTDVEGTDIFINTKHITHIYQLEDERFVVFLHRFGNDEEDAIEITNQSGLKLIGFLEVIDCGDDDAFDDADTIF